MFLKLLDKIGFAMVVLGTEAPLSSRIKSPRINLLARLSGQKVKKIGFKRNNNNNTVFGTKEEDFNFI